MVWLVVMAFLTVFGAVGLVVNVNERRWQSQVAQDVLKLTAAGTSAAAPRAQPDLPSPVMRYREVAVGTRAPVTTLKLRHGGTFCTSATAKPLPIEGTQVFSANPPGFVWSARVRMAPGVWIDARDMAVEGQGSMRVRFESTVTIADARGPEIDQGSALRLLAEMVWYPTALFDARFVTWSPIDAHHARATLRIGDRPVSATFEFGRDGLPVAVRASRWNDKHELVPWGGTYRDWRAVSGLLVPFEAEVSWQRESGPFTYAHWRIESMEFDGQRDGVPRGETHARWFSHGLPAP